MNIKSCPLPIVLRVLCVFFAEVWNLIDKDSTVYLNNNSSKKLFGVDGRGNVGTHDNYTLSPNNLWNKGKVDCSGFFTLTSLTAQKNLIGISAKKFGLVDKGM